MNESVDAGGIVAQRKTSVSDDDTTPTLKQKLADLAGQLIVELLPKYLSGQARIAAQDESLATQTTKLTKELGLINWAEPAEEIIRKIRAFQPWPGTYTTLNGKRLIILEAMLKDNAVLPKLVQLEGKKPVGWGDFLRGYQSQLTREPWYDKIYR
jgi:methionyl-tRNA formyltransferase